MSSVKQVFLSVSGALLVGVAIYWIDKFFDAKLAQASADAGKQPDLSSPQMPNLPQVSLQSIAPIANGNSSSNSGDSCDSCNGSSGKSSPANTPPAMSSAEVNIANLMSLLENNELNYNAPTSNIPTAPTIDNGSSYGVVNQSSIVNANNHGIDTSSNVPPAPPVQVWTAPNNTPTLQSDPHASTHSVVN